LPTPRGSTNINVKSKNSLIPDSVRFAGKRPPQTKLDEIRAKYLKKEANVQIVSRSKSGVTSHAKGKDSDESDEESACDFFSLESTSKEEIDEETFEKLKLPPPVFEDKRQEESLPAEIFDISNEAASSSNSADDVVSHHRLRILDFTTI
jgi:hypothetical protein